MRPAYRQTHRETLNYSVGCVGTSALPVFLSPCLPVSALPALGHVVDRAEGKTR